MQPLDTRVTFSHSSCGERHYTAWGRERSADTAQVKHETSCHLGGIVSSWLWNNSHRSVPFMLPYGSSKPTAKLPRHIAPLMPLTAVIIFQHFFFLFPKGKPDAWQCSHAEQHSLRALSAPDWACTHLEEPPLGSSAPRPQRALVG